MHPVAFKKAIIEHSWLELNACIVVVMNFHKEMMLENGLIVNMVHRIQKNVIAVKKMMMNDFIFS
jgi:hypothetical protein